jgi:predicted type IV restriction endonuclease
MTGEDPENTVVGQVTRQQIVERLLIAAGGFDVQHPRRVQ